MYHSTVYLSWVPTGSIDQRARMDALFEAIFNEHSYFLIEMLTLTPPRVTIISTTIPRGWGFRRLPALSPLIEPFFIVSQFQESLLCVVSRSKYLPFLPFYYCLSQTTFVLTPFLSPCQCDTRFHTCQSHNGVFTNHPILLHYPSNWGSAMKM